MRILLITPNFFDYPKMIQEELITMGHTVDWFDDRPSTNSVMKAIIRLKRDIVNVIIQRYFEEIIKKVGNKKYDKVIVISGQSFSFSENMMEKLKLLQNDAQFILYQWDSLKNFPYIKRFSKYFDVCYSFDRFDANEQEYLKFLPLFYAKKYEEIGKKCVENYRYDFLFVGTAHPKKYRLISEMVEKLKSFSKNQYIYFFFPSRLVFVYRKWKNIEFKRAKYKEFSFSPVSSDSIDKLLCESKCVLDSAQDGQNGLTIRVIETLGARRKLITTNEDVVNYDFYTPENIYVYNGEINFDSPFFTQPYKEIDESIYRKYSLREWLNVLLSF